MSYQDDLRNIKLYGKKPVGKKYSRIKNKSDKKLAQEAATKALLNDEDTMKEKWFKNRRKEMTGVCSCGCKQPSSKNDDKNFRSSCCHVFPQRIFESVQYHKRNFIEMAVWGGCHANLDEGGMDRWPKLACWDEIKTIFHELSPLLTEKEKATKFYSNFKITINLL